MDNNGSAIMLLLDDKSKRECDLNISELLDNDINIIESLDEINSDLINQGNRTLIILEKFPEIEGSISDLKLYKYAQKIASIEDDFHKNWVFVYELLSSEDLNYNYWKSLKKSNISFLKKGFRII